MKASGPFAPYYSSVRYAEKQTLHSHTKPKMAPNRKKNKKPVSNPARGFATTSIISKGVADSQPSHPEEESVTSRQTPTSLPKPVDVSSSAGHHAEPKDLSQLTADQLEAQLEESELQVFVEQHGPKSKKDASRYISKLQTERRVLRNQAERLHLARWLPDELAERITDHLKTSYTNNIPEVPKEKLLPGRKLSTDDSISKLWTLKQVLIGLGFPEASSMRAIENLTGNPAKLEKAHQSFSREVLWGLDECLEWLALFCSDEEFPEYDSRHLTKDEKLVTDVPQKEGQWALGKRITVTVFNCNGPVSAQEC